MTLDPRIADALATIDLAIGEIRAALDPPPVTPDTPPTPSQTLRFLQWNTHHNALGTDGKYDPDRFCDAVARMTPDVISLNEVDNVGSATGFHKRIVQRITGLWVSRWDERGNVLLSRVPLQLDVVSINPTIACRMVVGALANGLRIGSVHLDSVSAANRMVEVQQIVASGVDVVFGDFNMQPGSPEHDAMRLAYDDAWEVAKHLGTALNYPGNCDGCTKNSRIDYGWVRHGAAVRFVGAEVVDARTPAGVLPSDHKPLVVTLTV